MTERERLKDYLLDRFYREDWHGVSDAANDLRELDAEQRGINHAVKVKSTGEVHAGRGSRVETSGGEGTVYVNGERVCCRRSCPRWDE